MTDEYRFDNNYYGHIINVDEDELYIQGRIEDPLTMFRDLDNLLECERDNVQVLKGDVLK